jgi:signal transduction histidine kinase
LLALFVAVTTVPSASLVWVGWRMVQEDRVLERERVQERRDQAADLAAAALQRILAEAEDKLTTFSAAGSVPTASLGAGAALIVFGNGGLLARAGTPVLFFPALSPATPQSSLRFATPFSAADELEFRKLDLTGALRKLEETAHSKDPANRGEALLRMARIHRKLGDTATALRDFAELAKLNGVRVSGSPAGLRAAQGRALIFEASAQPAELHREAARLCEALEAAQWVLLRSEFDFSYKQARQWLDGKSYRAIDPDRFAIAEAAGSVWQEWQTRSGQESSTRGRRTFHYAATSVLLLTRSSADRVAALLISPRFLESAWLDELRRAVKSRDVDFALTDAEGQPILGDSVAPLPLQSVRPASATQLPWTVHAISTIPSSPELSGRTRLLLAGIAMMAVLLIAGGYFINRAVLREVTVARLQSDFVAAVSHEFRTPLTTVRQLAEMLARGRVSSEERRQRFYETLLSESERLHRLVEGLLNFGRMEAGQLQYRFETIDPERFVQDVVGEFQQEVASLGYQIELRGNGTLHPILGDRESLARVFWNLLDNAVKYSPERRTISVDLSEEGRRVAIQVRDEGLGIPATEQKEIFRKFVRGAASKNASIRGAGVGLAMAQQIVVAHGGDISVASEPGKGSTFTVRLPVALVVNAT